MKISQNNLKKQVILIALTIIPTLLIWFPFFARLENLWTIPLPDQGMATVVANFDGPLYLVAAKSFYNAEFIKDNFQFPLSVEYYSAHFPLFPLFIKLFAGIFGFPYSMLFVTVIFSYFALFYFNKLSRIYVKPNQALWLTTVFAIFPARWLIVRSVGSAEPLFISAILASLYYFNKKKYLLSGFAGGLAAMTKSPGILLFLGYAITIIQPYLKLIAQDTKNKLLEKLQPKSYWGLLLIPLGLVMVFSLYGFIYNDFFVYFKSGDNIHLFFPPFQIFNHTATWVGTFWLEEVIFIYLLGAIGVYKLKKPDTNSLYHFSLIYFISILFVAHRDLLRYALPITPLLLIAYKDVILSKEFKVAFYLIIIPIYLYSLSFISQNSMPISNWTPFL